MTVAMGAVGVRAAGRPLATSGRAGVSTRLLDRVASIDAFRGLAVMLMVLGNFEIGVAVFPAALKHTPDIGYTIADVVAPMFVLAIGLTVGASARRRRARDGAAAAYRHLASRGLMLIGIGAIISAGHVTVRPDTAAGGSWGVLQCLGLSCLLMTPVVLRPAWVRTLIGLGCLATYQWMLDRYWLDTVLHSPHNGLLGALSWTGLLLLATAVGDAYAGARDPCRQGRMLVVTGLVATVVGLLLTPWLPLSKVRASATFMLLSLGLCLLVFAVCHLLLARHPHRLLWLQRVGRNPLVLYLLSLVLLGIISAPAAEWWYVGAPLWLSLAQAAGIAAVIIGTATYLDRRNWIVSL